MNQRVNDPLGLNKSNPNKAWYYETTVIAVLDQVDEFIKKPKKRYDIKNTNFSQLDFPMNHLVFTFSSSR